MNDTNYPLHFRLVQVVVVIVFILVRSIIVRIDWMGWLCGQCRAIIAVLVMQTN